jgi:hypothetical protein
VLASDARIIGLQQAVKFASSPAWTAHEVIALAQHFERYISTGHNTIKEKKEGEDK